MKSKVIKIVFLVVLVHGVTAQESTTEQWINNPDAMMPPSFKLCSRNAPTPARNSCLKESMTTLLSTFKDGYPPLGIESLDPYHLGKARFEYATGPLATKVNMRDAISYGGSNVQIKTVRSKFTDDSLHIEMDVFFPKLKTEADFKGRSMFNQMKVKSEGHVKVNLYDVSCTFKIRGKAKASDPNYMTITSFDMNNIELKRLKLEGTGFVPDPDVNQLAIEFVNQNWRQFYTNFIPSTKESWEPLFLEMLNKVFERVPFDRIISKD